MPLSELPPPMGTTPDTPPGAEPPLLRVPPPGPMSRSWAARLHRVESPMLFEPPSDPPDADLPIVYAAALGSNVIDVDGNRFVDLAAGFGAILLGHGAQRTGRALEMQARRTWSALGDVFPADAKIAMLERVASLYPQPGARVLLTQSGSDAVTASIKTAALATKRPGVLAFEGAYHGLGYGPLSACGYRESFRQPFAGQLNPHVRFAPYPADDDTLDVCLHAAEKALASGDIGAVIVEPVLGRGGCVVPPAGFLPELASVAKRAGALLIADEIWTGLGRCGALLASSRVGVVPDILCLGKGLGGGLPISACVASDAVMQSWKNTPGVIHTSTFQGNPLACATGVAVIDAIRSGKLHERADQAGRTFLELLHNALDGIGCVTRITGLGMMIGIGLSSAQVAAEARRRFLLHGYILLTGGSDGTVLTLTPPLTIPMPLLEGFADCAARVLHDLSDE